MKNIIEFYNTSVINQNYRTDISSEDKKSYGIVYTPQFLADYVSQKTVYYFLRDFKKNLHPTFKKIRLIDASCGDGQLLQSLWTQLTNQLLAFKTRSALNPIEVLCGIDINKDAVLKTMARISTFSHSKDFFNFKIIKTNALFPFDSISREEGWKIVKDRFGAPEGFDIFIANPPWGADINFKESLLKREYRMYKGPFESADLFIELALSVIKPGGYFAFILPDSLFAFERKELREMLLSQTTIKFIARLGEKIFQDINRACAILIGKKEAPSFSHKIKCLRLTPEARNEILLNKKTFCDAEKLLAHEVYQQRFNENSNFLFDIDVKEGEEKTLNKIKSNVNFLGNYLISSRGVELSKTGSVCKCKSCGLWMPRPAAKKPRCPHCNLPIKITHLVTTSIISKNMTSKAKPLIVGENIKRYHAVPNRWILSNKRGIKYKDKSLYENPKMLVRKTGVGISASIDYSGAYTNQVVYIFKLKEGSPVSLEFLLAAINSRLIYYYIIKNYGENEWRSHPYITQKQILNIPLPDIDMRDDNQKMIIDRITRILRPYLKKNKVPCPLIDAQVEYLIAKFFKFTKKDYLSIFDCLNKAEELLPVKALKQICVADIFSEKNASSFISYGL